MSILRRHGAWLVLLVPVVLGLSRLQFDVEVMNLLPDTLPVVRGLKLYQQGFANARELIITLESAYPEETEHAARVLASRLRARPDLVSEVSWQPPFQEHPDQAGELLAYLWLNQPPEVFAELGDRLAGPNLTNTLAQAHENLVTSLSPQEIALRGYDPLGLMRLPGALSEAALETGSAEAMFVSADGRFRAMFVESSPDLANYRDCSRWLQAVHELIEATRRGDSRLASDRLEINYTGRPAFVAEIAGGMERDMTGSVVGTMVIIAGLFYSVHRRWRPLLWMLVLLALILAATTGLGGLLFASINVLSLGFAAISLGLAVDYGLVLYQEAQGAPQASARSLRRIVGPSILWSAVTTSSAFAMLNLSQLPGLAQLGSLVAIGVGLAALCMLFAFLPPLLGRGLPAGPEAPVCPIPAHPAAPAPGAVPHSARLGWIGTAILLLLGVGLLLGRGPRFDHTANALKPAHSAAYATVEKIKARLGRPREPLWVMVQGKDAAEISRRLVTAEGWLSAARSNGLVASYTLPTALWPNPAAQSINRPAAAALVQHRDLLHQAAFSQGFSSNAMVLTEQILTAWAAAAATTNLFWPTNQASHWLLEKLVARSENQLLALGLIFPATNDVASANLSGSNLPAQRLLEAWPAQFLEQGLLLSGWELLGPSIFGMVKKDLPRVLLSMVLLLIVSLALAFRRVSEVLLSLAALALSLLCLEMVMTAVGWPWNLMNMMALPLLLGAGVDYSIHMQLSLRRHHGDVRAVRKTVGRALFLCAATTVAGFGSLAFSSNTGLASLGRVCAFGITGTWLISLFLLPAWWKTCANRGGAV